jgi:hypothetical protein
MPASNERIGARGRVIFGDTHVIGAGLVSDAHASRIERASTRLTHVAPGAASLAEILARVERTRSIPQRPGVPEGSGAGRGRRGVEACVQTGVFLQVGTPPVCAIAASAECEGKKQGAQDKAAVRASRAPFGAGFDGTAGH